MTNAAQLPPPLSPAAALRVGVLGSYGGFNIGDESILACVLDCLRTHRPYARLVVFSRNA